MPKRFGRLDLPGAPGVALDAVQVSLQPLIRLLNVKTAQGFDLSSAIVPVVDVTRLIEGEAQAPKSLAYRAIDIPFRIDGDSTVARTLRASYTMKRPGRLTNAYLYGRLTVAPGPGDVRMTLELTRPAATPSDPDPPQANRAFQHPILWAYIVANAAIGTFDRVSLTGPIALQAGDLLEFYTQMGAIGQGLDYRFHATLDESVG